MLGRVGRPSTLQLSPSRNLWLAIVALCAGTFVLDLFLPLGVAIGTLYACSVCLAAKFSRDREIVLVAGGSTVLLLIGTVLGPIISGIPIWVGVTNRFLSIIVIWVPAAFLVQGYRARNVLQSTNEQLERRVCERTSELERSHEELRALTGRLLNAHEEERQRIARDLHDDFSQRLSMVLLGLEQILEEYPEGASAARARVQQLLENVSNVSDDLRYLAHEFHPAMLGDLGLVVAIRRFLDDWSQGANVIVRLESEAVPLTLPLAVATCLYRITQESLANIARHAHAMNVYVDLRGKDGGVALTVRDDGVGFMRGQRKEARTALGLLSMKERATLVGGTLMVDSELMRGTSVYAWVPVGRSAA